MANRLKVYTTGLLLTILSGCMTFPGHKLADLKPMRPMTSPIIQVSMGDEFSYQSYDKQLDRDNILVRNRIYLTPAYWLDHGYISNYTYAKNENFTGDAQYNLTVKGHVQERHKSSSLMRTLHWLTLWLIPASKETSDDFIYELVEVNTGKKYTMEVSDNETTTFWLLLFPALPFYYMTYYDYLDRIAEHTYQGFVRQGAFSTQETDGFNSLKEAIQPAEQ